MRLTLTIGLAASVAHAADVRFEEVAGDSGLPTVRSPPLTTNYHAAAAWLDWDRDGFPDLLLGDAPGPARLFLNRGDGTGFDEAAHPALEALQSVVAFDHLRDRGREALVAVTANLRREDLVVLVRDGDWQVVPVARPCQTLSVVSHGDLDADGEPELYVTHDVCGLGAAPLATLQRLVRRTEGYALGGPDFDGGGGDLLSRAGSILGCWPLAFVTDPEGDGIPALFVGNDFASLDRPAVALDAGSDRSTPIPAAYTMGFIPTERDGDGVLDYAITSLRTDLLWRSGAVEPLAGDAEWGEDGPRFKWGGAALDADNDGDEELWLTAGFLPAPFAVPDSNSRDVLLVDGADEALSAGVDLPTASRTIALAEWDRDGRVDALVGGLEAWTLFRNTSRAAGHWVAFDVDDVPGTRITVRGCGKTWVREWSSGQVGAVHERAVHVGLGECGEATADVQFPWWPARSLGALEVDRRHRLQAPRVWLEPSRVAPGGTVTVRSTEAGVTVMGAPADATFTAPDAAGVHRLEARLDGATLPVRPRLRVDAEAEEPLIAPWPVRVGDVLRVTVGGETVDGPTATGAVLEVAGRDVTPTPLIDAGRCVVEVETFDAGHRVRALLVDALSTSPADEVKVGAEALAHVGGKTVRVPLEMDVPGWFAGLIPREATRVSVEFKGQAVGEVDLTQPIGPLDPSRSRLWIVQPNVRADGQDPVEVVAWLTDARGRVVEPTAALLPTGDGLVLVDGVWRPVFDFGRRAWSTRLTGARPGLVQLRLGPLRQSVRLLPASRPPVEPSLTRLVKTGDYWTLVPRDAFGQRVGSGVHTEPPFAYVGNGEYVGAGDRVVLDGELWVTASGAGTVAEPEPSCGATGASRRAEPTWVLVLGMLVGCGRRLGRRTDDV